MSKSRIFIEAKMQNYLIVKTFLHFSLTVDAKLHPPKSRGTEGSFGHPIWGFLPLMRETYAPSIQWTKKIAETTWGWAAPSSDQAGTGLYFN